MDVRATVELINGLGVRVICLALGGVDLTSSAGKMTMQVVNAMAEFERDLLIERTQAGLARAVSEGKTLGRPSSLSKSKAQQVQSRLAAGEAVAALAREFGTSRQSIMRIRQAAL
jgi:putative DNA-invertase from lambdoid prophage Rac